MLVQIHSVRKVYNSNGTAFEALKGVGLGIREGDFVSITGESGSGKSTLLSILGGIAPPTSGEVLVDKIPIYELPAERLADFRREYIGFVFQQFHLIPYLSALENVMLPLCISGEKEMDSLALGALEKVGLKEKASRLPSELSGGEQQRVAIARALVNEPPIILADEPTGNLDSKTGEDIFHLFKELNHAGQTVVIVTHNPGLAKRTGLTVNMQDGMVLSLKDNHK
ncbi:MAG: ATP-binding cassette domain-containing protein [Armatimonadetes bacterium]|nr:ATP-binding cassette domain-containing protein [Armatimonadota bacterium]